MWKCVLKLQMLSGICYVVKCICKCCRHEKIHMRETPSKGALQPASGGSQLFSPGPGLEDPQHGRTTPYKSDRSTPSTVSSPHPTTPQSKHQDRSVQRSRNSSASSTGTHRSTPEPTPLDRYPTPEVLQHMYMQQMAMMQHMAQQQQQHGGSMNLMQSPYMMAAYMQQMHMMQQMATQDPNMMPYPPAAMESMMSSYAKSMEEYNKNLEQQSRKNPSHFPGSHSTGV